MEHEASDIVRLSVELIIVSLIVSMIAMFGSLSYRAYGYKQLTSGEYQQIEDITNLYWYDNKIVNASDAVQLMLTYPMKYTYIFEYRDTDGTLIERRVRSLDDQESNKVYKDYWSESGIRRMVDGYETSTFSANLLTNGSKSSIYGVIFTCQEG